MTCNDAAIPAPAPPPKPTDHVFIHTCSRCGVQFHQSHSYPPPGWVWHGSRLFCDSCQAQRGSDDMPAQVAKPAPHPMQAEYDRIMAEPRYQARELTIGWAVTHAEPPKLNSNGSMSTSMRFPILLPWDGLTDEGKQALVERVATLLEADSKADLLKAAA